MDTDYYHFEDHLPSIQWIEELPKGLVPEKIDHKAYLVTVSNGADGGYQIYIGPRQPYAGGDAIVVSIDANGKLVNYVLERLDPAPVIDEQ